MIYFAVFFFGAFIFFTGLFWKMGVFDEDA